MSCRRLNVLLFAFGHAGVGAIRGLRGAGHRVTGCFTHPTTAAWQPSVLDECHRVGIPCSTDPIADEGGVTPGMNARPDVVLSIFYRRRIEMPFLALGTIGAFNVAASQLPRYRGYFPFRWAILNNESMWGVTVHQMTHNYCDGAVLHRRPLLIKPTQNAYDLSLRLADCAVTAAVEAVDRLAVGDDHLQSLEPAIPPLFGAELPFGGAIDWRQPAGRIHSFIRALDFGRWVQGAYQHLTPPARASIGGEPLGIYQSSYGGTMSSYPAGTITRCDDEVWVQAGRGHVAVERMLVGGVDHDAAGYLTARGVRPGDTFDTEWAWDAAGGGGATISRAA